MENKKIVLVYCNWKSWIDEMTAEQAGLFIKWFFEYINDQEPKMPEDPIVRMGCKIAKDQLKTDLKKWLDIREKRIEAGRLGGIAKAENLKQNQQEIESVANASTCKQNLAKPSKSSSNGNSKGNSNSNGEISNEIPPNNADIRVEEENIEQSETSKLIENLEGLLGRILTIAETEIIISLRKKGYTRIQIYNEIKFYKDKKSPILYLKKKIENSQIQEQAVSQEEGNPDAEKWLEDFKDRHSKKEEIIEDTWMQTFNRAMNPDITPEERIEAMKNLHPSEPDRWVDPLEDR